MEDDFDISTDNVEFFFAQTKPERARTRHTPDVCALRSLGHGCVQEVKNDINTVRFLTQTARFVS